MRKFIGGSVALEHFGPKGEISLEEEQVMQAEASTAEVQVADDLRQVDTAIAQSDALEDLAVVADGIEEATPAEAALIDTTAAALVAPTPDVAPEEMVPVIAPDANGVPATESLVGKRIATEGIREVAKTIWENIQKFLKTIWEKIEKFFYNIFGTIPGLRKQIESMRKRVEAVSGMKQEDKKVTISSGVSALCVDYKPLKSGAELKKAFDALSTIGNAMYKDYNEEAAKAGEKIADAISDFDLANPAKSLNAITTNFNVPGGDIVKGGPDMSKRFPGFKAGATPPLMGNVSIVVKHPEKMNETNDTSLASAEQARRSGVELIPTSDKTTSSPSDFEFATMSGGEMEQLLSAAEKLLDTLEEYKRGKATKDLKKAKDRLKAASDKAEKTFSSVKSDEDNKAAVPYYRAMLNFNATFTRWVQSPAMPLFSHSLQSIRAVLMVCGKCCSAYK